MKDLLKIWTDMSKPDEYSGSSLEDFFQVFCLCVLPFCVTFVAEHPDS